MGILCIHSKLIAVLLICTVFIISRSNAFDITKNSGVLAKFPNIFSSYRQALNEFPLPTNIGIFSFMIFKKCNLLHLSS